MCFPRSLSASFLQLILFMILCQSAFSESYEHERLRFRVELPFGWRVVNPGSYGDEPFELWKSDADGPRIQIVALPFDLDDPVKTTVVQQELSTFLHSEFLDLTEIQEKAVTHKGYPAIEILARLTTTLGNYHIFQRSLFAQDRIYIITCASYDEMFQMELPLFRKTANSLELIDRIYDPLKDASRSLVTAPLAVLLLASTTIVGFVLRSVSITRLRRAGRWPLPRGQP